MRKPSQPESELLPPDSFWCPCCRAILYGPTSVDRADHALDEHRADLIAGRLKLLTEAEAH